MSTASTASTLATTSNSPATSAPEDPFKKYLDPNKFWNHGDNPALKNFARIVQENTKDSKWLDPRTFVVYRGQRYS
jgi:hypothetical protein